MLTKTVFIGKVFHHFSKISSTNVVLRGLIRNGSLAEGAVVMADFQEAGKGQLGAHWESAPGENLLCSIYLTPTFLAPTALFLMNQMVSVALLQALHHIMGHDDAYALKWPNDLYIGHKKCAGILMENSIKGNALQHTIIGIGLNVNQNHFSERLHNPTSMRLCRGTTFEIMDVLKTLLYHLELGYLNLRQGDSGSIQKQYTSSLYRKDVASQFTTSNGEEVTGIIRGVSEAGHLFVEIGGKIRSFLPKEIQFTPDNPVNS